MRKLFATFGLLGAVLTFACFAQARREAGTVKKQPFGRTAGGTPVDLYTLGNRNGMEVSIATYGATIVSVTAPDRRGVFADVVLGCEDVAGYEHQTAFLGALIGRYGNRIGHARFRLGGVEYRLPANDGPNTLHGGPNGFDKRIWHAAGQSTQEGASIQLTYLSKDGEEGFPGNLSAKVVYTLTNRNELKIEYTATTDKDTVVNLTNHSYFNLAGQGSGDVLQHQVELNAKWFTPVDAELIPTGELRTVAGTPFDFTHLTAIGARIDQNDEQLQFGKGYDHNWVLEKTNGSLSKAAEVYEPQSGRVLEVWTTEPGVQFYTANHLDGTIHGKGGKVYRYRGAFCLETQHFPDSPNQPRFPSTELKPGQTYHSTTVYRFSTR
ncbi:MAG TPA: aldose epimerase family protein [Bryobacteraceae bacterium]|nr:aldose epimerase family protein [Bryobacteraceae bacterium]